MACFSACAPLRTNHGDYCDECAQPGTSCWCSNDGYMPDDFPDFN